MPLPYERQIMHLLQEIGHYQVIIRRCRKEKLTYMDELSSTCKEIEQMVYELEKKQQPALSQWHSAKEESLINHKDMSSDQYSVIQFK